MKVFNGTDIIEVKRIENNIKEHGDRFLNRVYTSKEIEYCESKKEHKYESYAARFAAKESIYKAVSNIIKDSLSWKDIEITNEENGRPKVIINSKDLNIKDIDLSLSHIKDFAMATVIVLVEV